MDDNVFATMYERWCAIETERGFFQALLSHAKRQKDGALIHRAITNIAIQNMRDLAQEQEQCVAKAYTSLCHEEATNGL